MNDFVKVLLATIVGSFLGFIYFYFLGCKSGSCAITSHPLNSTVYGAFMGMFWYLPNFWIKKK